MSGALLRAPGAWTALAAIALAALAGGAEAHGRGWAFDGAHMAATRPAAAGSARDLVVVAERNLGMSNFAGLPGAWCAWAVSAWLRATGRPELSNGLAASALAYGPLELHARRGDLVVMRTRRGPYGHVGVVVADEGREIEIISGNWLHRVALARIARRTVTAFVRV
jgi:CHAP domain